MEYLFDWQGRLTQGADRWKDYSPWCRAHGGQGHGSAHYFIRLCRHIRHWEPAGEQFCVIMECSISRQTMTEAEAACDELVQHWHETYPTLDVIFRGDSDDRTAGG